MLQQTPGQQLIPATQLGSSQLIQTQDGQLILCQPIIGDLVKRLQTQQQQNSSIYDFIITFITKLRSLWLIYNLFQIFGLLCLSYLRAIRGLLSSACLLSK